MLLQISIPTFNRNLCLHKLLSSIETAYSYSRIADLSSMINISIYDNNNDYESSSIADAFKPRLPNLKYYHNGGNIGADLNIKQCYIVDESKFVHVIADDDLVDRGYFNRLIPTLINARTMNSISLLFLPAFGFDDDFFIKPYGFSAPYHMDSKRMVEKFNVKLTFISSLVIFVDVDVVRSRDDPFAIGTGLGQLSLFLLSSTERQCCIVLDNYLIAAKRDNAFVTDKLGVVSDNFGKKIHNDLLQIYILNYFSVFEKCSFEVTYKHRYNHFNGFILWEIWRRGYLKSGLDTSKISKYYHDIWSFKLLQKLSYGFFSSCLIFIISFCHRLFSFEATKIFIYAISKFKSIFFRN